MANDREVAAVRVLVRAQRVTDDEVAAVPDATHLGFRVTRRVHCCLDAANEETYLLKTAGVSADVQWLMTAAHNDVFLVTAMLQTAIGSTSAEFNVLAHMPVPASLLSDLVKLMRATLNASDMVTFTHVPAATPTKRLQQVMSTSTEPAAPESLSKRRRLGQGVGSA